MRRRAGSVLLCAVFCVVFPLGASTVDQSSTDSEYEYWLEIAANGSGAYGSHWRTDAVALNKGAGPATVTLIFHGAHGDRQTTRTIPAGAQVVVEDLVGVMGVQDKGPLEIRSSQPLDVIGRIYNKGPRGTFGQFLNGIGVSDAYARGESAFLLGLRQQQGLYRTNLSVTNIGNTRATVLVKLYAADGSELSRYTLSPRPSEVIQDLEPISRRAGRPDLGWGFASVTVTSGDFVLTSASVIDSRTNDATTVGGINPGDGSTTGRRDLWLEIASHAPGVAGSQWRTLVAARNEGSASAVTTVTLDTGEETHQLTKMIEAGAQAVFDDIIGSMHVEEKGSLRIRSSQPLEIVGRIYNQAQGGTYGQFLNGYEACQGLSRGESAWLLGLRQESGAFRSNISVTNTGRFPATVRITLFRNNGAELASYELEPKHAEVIQDTEPFVRRAGVPDLGWGFAKVTVISGDGVLTSASVIDSRTNDATTIALKRENALGTQRPEFSGLTTLSATDVGEVYAEWLPAYDDATKPDQMLYHVHVSNAPGIEPTPDNLAQTLTGDRELVLRELDPDTEYYVEVIAENSHGLRSMRSGAWPVTTLMGPPVPKPEAVLQRAEDLNLGTAILTADCEQPLRFERGQGTVLPEQGKQLTGPMVNFEGELSRYLITVGSIYQPGDPEIFYVIPENSCQHDPEDPENHWSGWSDGVFEELFEKYEFQDRESTQDPEGVLNKLTQRWGAKAAASSGLSVFRETRKDGSVIARVTRDDGSLYSETKSYAGSSNGYTFGPGPGANQFIISRTDQATGEITVEASLDFFPTINVDASLGWFKVKSAEFSAQADLHLATSAEVGFWAAGDLPVFRERLWEFRKDRYFWIGYLGPIKMTIRLTLDAEVAAMARSEIYASAHASASTSVKVGAKYESGSWRPISNFDFDKSFDLDFDTTGGLTTIIRLVPKASVTFFNSASGWVSLEPALIGSIWVEDTMLEPCAPFQLDSLDVFLAAEANVGLNLKIFKKALAAYELCVWGTFSDCLLYQDPWPLFSLPESEILWNGEGQDGSVDVWAEIADGTNNAFRKESALWLVSPLSTGQISSDPVDETSATLNCTASDDYDVTFSGYGRLGEFGRRCTQERIACSPGETGVQLVVDTLD